MARISARKRLEKLPKGELKPEKQGESPTEYARMLTKDMGNLNWNESAEKLERLIRGLNPVAQRLYKAWRQDPENLVCAGL